jgi:hypothetical protein
MANSTFARARILTASETSTADVGLKMQVGERIAVAAIHGGVSFLWGALEGIYCVV